VLLVGFGYKARQGKNTAAHAFLEQCPLESEARFFAFADALRAEVTKAVRQYKTEAALISAWKESGLMPDWVRPELGKARTLYQWWGTDFRRAQDPDYWIKRLFATFTKIKPDTALVTDVRFPNEADAILAAGGYLVKVTRLGKPDIVVHEHPSERALDGYNRWTHELTAATVDELKKKTLALYREIERKHGNNSRT
jgi:hypothetical protein